MEFTPEALLWLGVHPLLLRAGSVPVPSAAAASPPPGCVREAEQGMFSISPCYFWLGCLLCNRCGNCYAWGFIKETLRALLGRNSPASGCDSGFIRAGFNWEQRFQEVFAGSVPHGGKEQLKGNGREEPPAHWERGAGLGTLVLLGNKKKNKINQLLF